MALSKKPVNGMKDIMPAEMEIRDYVSSVIRKPIAALVLHQSRPHAWKILQTLAISRVEKMKN